MSLLELVHERFEVLQSLAEGSKETPEVEREVTASRPTVYRALEESRSEGIVEKNEEREYRLTLKGRVIVEDLQRHLRDIEKIDRHKGYVEEWLPRNAELDPAILRGAEFYTEEEGPIEELVSLIREAEAFKGFSSSKRVEMIEGLVKKLEEGADVDIVTIDEILDIMEDYFEEDLQDYLEVGGNFYRYPNEIPVAQAIYEGRDWSAVAVNLTDPEDRIKLMALNRSSEAYRAARKRYEEALESSTHYSSGERPMILDRKKLEEVVKCSNDFISISKTEDEAQVKYLNPAGRRMMGLPVGGKLPDRYRKIENYHPDWAIKKLKEEGRPTVEEEGTWIGETALITAEGEEIPVRQTLVKHGGESEGFFSTIIHDLSELKERERRVERLEEEEGSSSTTSETEPS